MHQRKKMMFDMADAFVALPGGLGTMDEMFEMLTWSSLGYHSKPCIFLNVNGYYNSLLLFLDFATRQNFIKREHRVMALAENSVSGLMNRLLAQQ
jgi:uncharacterized protein (TIGR00730 family)